MYVQIYLHKTYFIYSFHCQIDLAITHTNKSCVMWLDIKLLTVHCSNGRIAWLYRVSRNLCHKLFLGIPHPHLSKKVPINMGPKVNRFRDIDLRSCTGIEYYIRCSNC
jgi:hypothetical protein